MNLRWVKVLSITKAVKAKQYSSKISQIWLIRGDIRYCIINIDFLIFAFGHIVLLVILFMPRLALLIVFNFKKMNFALYYFYNEVNPGNCSAAYCNYLQKFELQNFIQTCIKIAHT